MIENSDHPEIDPVPSEPADSPGCTPLDHVIDDQEPKEAWSEWTVEQMTKGRTPEELAVELVANGWSEDDATELVENARRSTRHLRGVITRDEVARESASRYRKATALSWFTTFISIASAWRLLNSLAFILGSRRRRPLTPGFPVQPAATAEPRPHSDSRAVESTDSSP